MRLVGGELEVVIGHEVDELAEAGGGNPAELLFRLRGVAEEQVDLGRTEVARVDLDQSAAVAVDPAFGDAAPLPPQLDAGSSCCSMRHIAST